MIKNFWLDRIRKKEEEKKADDIKEGKYVYPPTLLKLIAKKQKKLNKTP